MSKNKGKTASQTNGLNLWNMDPNYVETALKDQNCNFSNKLVKRVPIIHPKRVNYR